ncbi:MAG: hypothetical protein Tsb002_17020 [Wenzhouxiangellaceae bacterium]
MHKGSRMGWRWDAPWAGENCFPPPASHLYSGACLAEYVLIPDPRPEAADKGSSVASGKKKVSITSAGHRQVVIQQLSLPADAVD